MRYHNQLTKQARAIRSLGLDATLIGLAYAGVETIWSIYIYSFFPNESQVGFISAIFSLSALLSLLFAYPLFKKFSPQELLFASVGANAIILALFAQINNPTIFVCLGILNALLIGVRVQSFGVLLRHNSSKNNINKDENFIYVLMNIGWISGPLIAGYIANTIALRAVLIVSSIALLLSVYSITYNKSSFRKEQPNQEINVKRLDNIKSFFRDKKRVLAYFLSGSLEVWWSISYIFLPVIMVTKYDFSLSSVGIFLFLLIIPNTLVELSTQKKEIKDLRKRIGIGYLIISAVALIAGLSGSIFVILGAMIVGSFGVGFIEPTVEGYFFSITKEKESKKFYGSFMTAKQVGAFTGKILIASILINFSIHESILTIGIIMFLLSMWSLKKHEPRHIKKNN